MDYKIIALLFGLLLIFNINLISGEQQTLKGIKQGECATIPQSHPNATSINITKIRFPNDTENYTVIPMITDNGFNFYYNFCNTTQVGEYVVTTCGNGDGVITCMDFDFPVTLSGEDRNMTVIIADIFIILAISLLIFVLHSKYKKAKDNDSTSKITEAHNGNWAKTFIKTLGNNLMKNSFLWYYSLGWLLLFVFKDLIYTFNTSEIYNFFVLFLDIYSFGFFLVIVVWIGILINHFKIITDIIEDMNMGVEQ